MKLPRTIQALLVTSLACCLAPATFAAKDGPAKIPKARYSKGVYTAFDGKYTVKVPPMLEPGGHNEEQRTAERSGVFFADDMGKAFFVLVTDNRKTAVTLDSIATEFTVGGDLKEKEFVETPRGRELRVAGIRRGESPIASQTKKDGKTVETQLDLVQATSLFLHGGDVFMVGAGVTILKDAHRTEGELIAEAKTRLNDALESMVIKGLEAGK